ncbi:MAG: putative transposase [Candidatus Xenobiia bacterium LiM19]
MCSIQPIKITGYGEARLIPVKKKGHQTPVITNDWERPAIEIVSLMFDRWRQENFFKYMAANYSIDELVSHEEHEATPSLIANPHWHELGKKIGDTRKKIAAMEREIGRFVAQGSNRKAYDDERKSPFVQKKAALKRMKTNLQKLKEEKKHCPLRISPSELGISVCTTIPKEGKIILDTVKLLVYNAEEWLLEIMQWHYRDWRDPRPIVQMIVRQQGDIQVGNGVIKITLHKFGQPSYQQAARGLCEEMTNLEVRSWDGRWRFVYEVADG